MHTFVVPKRKLGGKGPEVPVYALGSWNTWDRMSAEEAVSMVQRAHAVGAAFFDVAYYNMGPHEEHSKTDILFGQAVRNAGLSRKDYLVCGKLWLWEYPNLKFREQTEVSLERARLDRFDMVVMGDYMAKDLDVERIVTEVNVLIKEGLIGGWGINNWHIDHTRAALDFADRQGLEGPLFAQLKYSVVRRSMAEGAGYGELFASGRLGLQASDCLEGGILAGKGVPQRKIGFDAGGIREKIYAAVPEIEALARRYDATPVQLALAFCLANQDVGNVLFGASRLGQLEDNLGAITLAERAGAEIRQALDHLWLDRHVSPDGGL